MKNQRLIFIIKLFSCVIFMTVFCFFLRIIIGSEVLVSENSGFGWYVGILGTLYTFIAAFIIVTVWGQFNTTTTLVSKEAKHVASIWNYVDYLNDEKASEKMNITLVKYVDKVIKIERKELSDGIRTIHPSIELIEILKIIDSIKFNDSRDSSIYPSLIQAYEELSAIRSERIDSGLTRIPQLIKILFILLTLVLLISIGLLGYINIGIFLFSIISASILIITAYLLADDLDNPFEGFWNIDFSSFDHVRKYIEDHKHN